jgi:hypothetical protein
VIASLAYVLGTASLTIVDVSQPDAPSIVWTGGGVNRDIAITGTRMYISTDFIPPGNPALINAYDLTSPSSPASIGFMIRDAFDIAAAGNYLYVAESSGLAIVDFTVPSAPTVVGSVPTPSAAFSVGLIGQFACVAIGPNGMRVIDVSVPQAPVVVGGVATEYDAMELDIVEGRAHVMQPPSFRVDVIEIATPSEPAIVARFDAPGATPQSAVGDAGYMYVTASASGLIVYPLPCSATTNSGVRGAGSSTLGYVRRAGTSLQIHYSIGRIARYAHLAIYDVRGRLVSTLYRGAHEPGVFFRGCDGRSNAGWTADSGVYVVRFDVDAQSHALKALWLR